MSVIISADNELKTVSDYKIERIRVVKSEDNSTEDTVATTYSHHDEEFFENETDTSEFDDTNDEEINNESLNDKEYQGRYHHGRRSHYDRRRKAYRRDYNRYDSKEKESPVILYSSHDDINIGSENVSKDNKKEGKAAWWRRLIG